MKRIQAVEPRFGATTYTNLTKRLLREFEARQPDYLLPTHPLKGHPTPDGRETVAWLRRSMRPGETDQVVAASAKRSSKPWVMLEYAERIAIQDAQGNLKPFGLLKQQLADALRRAKRAALKPVEVFDE